MDHAPVARPPFIRVTLPQRTRSDGVPGGTAAQPDASGTLATVPSDWEHDVRRRLAAGEDHALNEVYEQYSSFVYGLALRVIGDPRAAEDIAQDVFVFVWEHPEAFDPARVAANLARDTRAPARRRLRAA
jgi:hypothetical protein